MGLGESNWSQHAVRKGQFAVSRVDEGSIVRNDSAPLEVLEIDPTPCDTVNVLLVELYRKIKNFKRAEKQT